MSLDPNYVSSLAKSLETLSRVDSPPHLEQMNKEALTRHDQEAYAGPNQDFIGQLSVLRNILIHS